MEHIKTVANETLTRTTGTLRGRTYELVTFRGGRTELYEEYADTRGLQNFVGYADDLLPHFPATFARDLSPLFQAHEAEHVAFWAAYLPGASAWLHQVAS